MAPALRVGPENVSLGVTRRLFGATKLRSLYLDWYVFGLNSGDSIGNGRP